MNIWSIFGSVEVDGSQAVTELGNVQDQARRTGDSLERDVVQKANRTSEQLRDLGGGLRSLGLGLSAAITAPVTALVGVGVKSAAELEVFSNSLNVMIGDAEKAQALFDELYEFSASTPFEWRALTEATRQLVAFGVESDAVIPLMRQLGDVAAGLDTPIEDLAQIFGRVLVNGKMSMEEVNRLAERGVPIYSELAEVLGVAESEIRDMVSSGDINITHLQQVFANLTKEGGKFGGMMEALATTTIGKWATLKDTFSVVTDLVGERLLPTVNQVLDWAASAVDWFVELDEDLQNNIITIVGIVAAIGPLLAAGGQLITMLSGNAGLTAVFGLLKGAMAFLTGPTGILLVIAGLITNEVVQSMGGWQVVIESLLGWIQKLWQDAQPALEALRDVFASVFAAIQDLWEDGLKPAIRAVAPLVERVFGAAGVAIEALLTVLTSVVRGVAALLSGDFTEAWDAAKEAVAGILTGLLDVLDALFGDMARMALQAGKDLLQGLINGLNSMWENAKGAVTNLGNNVLGWFKDTLGIKSPSTVFYAFGVNIVEGLVGGLSVEASRAETAIADLAERVVLAALTALGLNEEKSPWVEMGEAIMDGIASGLELAMPGFFARLDAALDAVRAEALRRRNEAALAYRDDYLGSGGALRLPGAGSPVTPSVTPGEPFVPGLLTTPTRDQAAFMKGIERLTQALMGERSPLGRSILDLNRVVQLATDGIIAVLPDAVPIASPDVRAVVPDAVPIAPPDPYAVVPLPVPIGAPDVSAEVMPDRSHLPYDELQAILQRELDARKGVIDGLLSMSTEKGVLANFGSALADLVVSKVPLFGAALDGFVQAGPIGALISIFTELLGRSEAFNHIMGMLNSILDPIVSALDVLFTALTPIIEVAVRLVEVALLPLTWVIESVLAPVITFVGGAIVGVYNAIASAVNWALGWAGVRLKKIPWPPSAGSAPSPSPSPSPGGGGGGPTGVVVRPIAPAPAPDPYEPPPPPEPYRPTPAERREEARVVSEAFGSTAQTLQLAVATPLVEASRMFAMAAEGIANVFGGVAGSQGASGMLPFSEAIANLTPVLERLLLEGVSINVNTGSGGAPNRDRGTAYLRTGSII